jgi:ABC-type amino acid transport substrate-binding protein
MLDEGGDYTDFEIWGGYTGKAEQFAIGFRKEDTKLCEKINKIIAQMEKDGRLKKIAGKYGLGDLI